MERAAYIRSQRTSAVQLQDVHTFSNLFADSIPKYIANNNLIS